MPRKDDTDIKEWVNTAFKGLVVCVFSMGIFVFNNFTRSTETSFNNLNETLKSLSNQLKVIESHQVDADKRIAIIETAREINTAGYQKLLTDVTDIKATIIQNTMRIQTLSDFIAKHWK